MNKANDKPRKVYKRNGIVHLCFDGNLFAPEDSAETKIDPTKQVKQVVELETEGKVRAIEVVQNRPGKKAVTEEWYETKIPAGKRGRPRKSEAA